MIEVHIRNVESQFSTHYNSESSHYGESSLDILNKVTFIHKLALFYSKVMMLDKLIDCNKRRTVLLRSNIQLNVK